MKYVLINAQEDFYIVRFALAKEQIDECIRISETYQESESETYTFPLHFLIISSR